MMPFHKLMTRVAVLATLVLSFGHAHALDKLIVGRSIGSAITFTPLEIGTRAGIWQRNGLDLQVISFGGDAQLQQALIANTVQVGLGSGPALAFVVKGVPVKGIGAFGKRPYNLCLAIATNSGVKSLAGLKGKRIGVTTLGSLTHWLVLETSRRNGWKGSDALVPVPLGPPAAQLAAMTRGQISGRVTTVEQAYTDEVDGVGHIELNYGDMLDAFITHVFFARNDVIAHDPEVLRRFLQGWVQTIEYMKAHQAESIQTASKVLNLRPEIVTKSFPYVLATLSTDLTFDPGALAVLSRSFLELGILPKQPDMTQLYTNQFIPARP
jgi:NitT/TauT family transport system substrate-binding protein